MVIGSCISQKLMGKKKVVKKTKELSVAIAESSAMSGDSQQQITPRKRGRPRKIVVKNEDDVSADLKKLKTSEVEEPEGEKKKQEEDFVEEKKLQSQNQQPTRSSRARRKSKPIKSC
ncbi:hypothetical protein BC332_32227 [Capsicum chinense]|nr:hypothetical protein BC332_32227 [Capsicum chinense]